MTFPPRTGSEVGAGKQKSSSGMECVRILPVVIIVFFFFFFFFEGAVTTIMPVQQALAQLGRASTPDMCRAKRQWFNPGSYPILFISRVAFSVLPVKKQFAL